MARFSYRSVAWAPPEPTVDPCPKAWLLPRVAMRRRTPARGARWAPPLPTAVVVSIRRPTWLLGPSVRRQRPRPVFWIGEAHVLEIAPPVVGATPDARTAYVGSEVRAARVLTDVRSAFIPPDDRAVRVR